MGLKELQRLVEKVEELIANKSAVEIIAGNKKGERGTVVRFDPKTNKYVVDIGDMQLEQVDPKDLKRMETLDDWSNHEEPLDPEPLEPLPQREDLNDDVASAMIQCFGTAARNTLKKKLMGATAAEVKKVKGLVLSKEGGRKKWDGFLRAIQLAEETNLKTMGVKLVHDRRPTAQAESEGPFHGITTYKGCGHTSRCRCLGEHEKREIEGRCPLCKSTD